MVLNHRIEYLRKEHEELLNLARRIEKALESASKNEVAEHLKSLNELRSLEHGFAGIVEHCHAEDHIVESMYHQSLQQDERDRINAEHEQIIRAVTNFREEMKFATTKKCSVESQNWGNRRKALLEGKKQAGGLTVKREDTPLDGRRRRRRRM